MLGSRRVEPRPTSGWPWRSSCRRFAATDRPAAHRRPRLPGAGWGADAGLGRRAARGSLHVHRVRGALAQPAVGHRASSLALVHGLAGWGGSGPAAGVPDRRWSAGSSAWGAGPASTVRRPRTWRSPASSWALVRWPCGPSCSASSASRQWSRSCPSRGSAPGCRLCCPVVVPGETCTGALPGPAGHRPGGPGRPGPASPDLAAPWWSWWRFGPGDVRHAVRAGGVGLRHRPVHQLHDHDPHLRVAAHRASFGAGRPVLRVRAAGALRGAAGPPQWHDDRARARTLAAGPRRAGGLRGARRRVVGAGGARGPGPAVAAAFRPRRERPARVEPAGLRRLNVVLAAGILVATVASCSRSCAPGTR